MERVSNGRGFFFFFFFLVSEHFGVLFVFFFYSKYDIMKPGMYLVYKNTELEDLEVSCDSFDVDIHLLDRIAKLVNR
jgi:hypothetical protein